MARKTRDRAGDVLLRVVAGEADEDDLALERDAQSLLESVPRRRAGNAGERLNPRGAVGDDGDLLAPPRRDAGDVELTDRLAHRDGPYGVPQQRGEELQRARV